MPINPNEQTTISSVLNQLLGPVNRAAQSIMDPEPSEYRRMNVPLIAGHNRMVGKPGAPTMTQQMLGALLSALNGIAPGRRMMPTNRGFGGGPPEYPITTDHPYVDPRTGEIFKVPRYDARPPRRGPSDQSFIQGLESDLRSRRASLIAEEERLVNEYMLRDTNTISARQRRAEIERDIINIRNDIENLHNQIESGGGHFTRSTNHDPVDYFPGRRRNFNRRDEVLTRGSDSSGHSSIPGVNVGPEQIGRIMSEFGYNLGRDRTSASGLSRYQTYEHHTPNLPMMRMHPESRSLGRLPSNRFMFRYSDHKPSETYIQQNNVPSGRLYDISPMSPWRRSAEDIRRDIAERLGVRLPEPARRTPVHPDQLDLFRDYIQSR